MNQAVIDRLLPPSHKEKSANPNPNRMALATLQAPWDMPVERGWTGPTPIDENLQTIEQTSWLGFQFFEQRLSDRVPAVMQDIMKQYRGWIYVCGNKRANAVASNPWHLNAVRKRGQKMYVECASLSHVRKTYLRQHPVYGKMLASSRTEPLEILEHPFLDLMADGNQVSWAGYDLLHLTVLCLSLVGNAFWYMPSSSLGIPDKLYITLPHLTWVIPNFSLGGALVYGTGGSVFRNEEIIHFACPSPLSTWQGFGAGSASWFTMKRLEKAEEFENSLQTNGIFPSGILSPDLPLTQDQIDYADAWLKANHAGVRKAGKIVIPPWPSHLLTPQIQTDAIRFLADHSVSRNEICAIHNVPIAMVDEPKSAANAFWATQQFTKDAVLPDCNHVASAINRKIIPRYDSEKRLFFAFDNPVPQDEDMLHKRLKMGVQAQSLKRKEVRAALNSMGLGIELDDETDSEKANEYVGGGQFNERPPKEMADVVAPTGTRDGED